MRDRATYLAIYLNDHYAGATLGRDLARRIAGRDDRFGAALGGIADEIAEDRRRLEELMERLGIRRDPVKAGLAWAAEKVGRAKLNGHLLRRSPLSRLEELEMLSLGVEGKASLWRSLRIGLADDRRVEQAELDALLARAEDQRARLEALRLDAVGEALSP